jgi:hypothetical protein
MGEMSVGECPGSGYGDGGTQLRPDDNGARPSAGKRLAAATAERTGFIGDGFQICCSNSAYLFVLYIRPLSIAFDFVTVAKTRFSLF